MMHNKTLTLIIISIAVIILSGCSFVRIQNVSDAPITVSVNVPDSGKSYTRNIRAGDIVDVFSANGGRYTVTMIPGERYRESLGNLQQLISTRLFEERATLTAEEVTRLVQNLNEIDKLIEDLATPMPSCSGYLPDFDTVVVVAAFDAVAVDYVLSCSSGEG